MQKKPSPKKNQGYHRSVLTYIAPMLKKGEILVDIVNKYVFDDLVAVIINIFMQFVKMCDILEFWDNWIDGFSYTEYIIVWVYDD